MRLSVKGHNHGDIYHLLIGFRGLATNLMCSRFYERVISKVSANIGLDNFPADSFPWDKVFIVASSHGVPGR